MAPEIENSVLTEETAEWLESLDDVVRRYGTAGTRRLLAAVESDAHRQGVPLPFQINTPYLNTIPVSEQPRYPGSREIERRLRSIIRWNALAMVVRANKEDPGIGGHISTYASAATLLEVGFNHFFRGKDHPSGGDLIYFQGHASPGIYARAFLEGRLSEDQIHNYRKEIPTGKGVSSYPHPWLMPKFWEFPTVSMGLGPLMAIYQARFNRYLHDRGLKDTSDQKVWCFLGDGEVDEPESLGSITLAAREHLDNLIFVVNCNLQRLDGPVRGNGKIIQELEAAFRGAGWNVIKVIWGRDWDPLLAADESGHLVERMNEVVDGQFQKYVVEPGSYIREHFFGKFPDLLKMVEHLTDDQLRKLNRGGHDPEKVYAAYQAAVTHKGSPTVILAKTIKGYGLGESGEGRNVTHQQKKLNEDELRAFRARFGVPIGDDKIDETPFYKPPEDAPEMRYMRERREELGGFLPERRGKAPSLEIPGPDAFNEFAKGSGERPVATIMAFVRLLSRLLRDEKIGKRIVPIFPDEARTFGMDVLFRQAGIYAHAGQKYEPVDKETLLYYREAKDGQLLEEGINEAGSMASFIAAGTAYANHNLNLVPFFSFYSMFGFQRIGDLIWAAADSRCKGFLMGGIAGRTTLAGEGLQHQDGHSLLMAATVPNLQVYDPAFAYELAVVIRDGMHRMYTQNESIFYYITMYNETYAQPAMPKDSEEGILRGMYRFSSKRKTKNVTLLGSGPILREVLRAQDILADRFDVGSDVWSVTSYKALRRDALAVDRWNLLHPEEKPRKCYVEECLAGAAEPIIAASDYMKLVPEQIARWVPGRMEILGTDGFGRSEGRTALRRFFEVDAEHIAFATLSTLARQGKIDAKQIRGAIKDLGVDPEKVDPILL
ncbi:MAG TPA: pyruvate dehydrogenase (acetyl-transferring), homodimeric type [Gemmataceae bacterium]|nr:pyruvate dehydrogenase (acetyl-transferring), homodimeric type [Gemmataceae bacterium]